VGGAGGSSALPCAGREDCPADGPCIAFSCTNDVCQPSFAPAGTPVPGSPAGDCRSQVCNESGTASDQADDSDVFDDGNDCTDNLCVDGMPQNPPKADGEDCGRQGPVELYCAGGVCVGCTMAEQCSHNECQDPTCLQGQCGTTQKAEGFEVLDVSNSDCIHAVCDANGMTVPAADPNDMPDDMNDCTTDTCTGTVPTFSNLANGIACSSGYCYVGACSECGINMNCMAPCQIPTCVMGACQNQNKPDGIDECMVNGELCCAGACTPGTCGAGGGGGAGGAGGAGGS
jgi:hypothetical protein